MSKQKRKLPGHAKYTAWVKSKRHDPRVWIKHEMNTSEIHACADFLIKRFKKRPTYASELILALGGLSYIAGINGNKVAAKECIMVMTTVAKIYCELDY